MAALQVLQRLVSHPEHSSAQTQASRQRALPNPWLLCLRAAGSASRPSWGWPPRAQRAEGRLQQQSIRLWSASKASQVPSLYIRNFT